MAILRLNYAIDLRYGILLDIAEKVYTEQPISLEMGNVNVIWQRDANAVALAGFLTLSKPTVDPQCNRTGDCVCPIPCFTFRRAFQ